MWVRLSDSMIIDAQPPLPSAGSVLSAVGLRARGDLIDAVPGSAEGIVEIGGRDGAGPQDVLYELTGVAGEAADFEGGMEREGRRHWGAEFVLTVNGSAFQVQFDGAANEVVGGSRVIVRGKLFVVGDYEWEAFPLRDTRAQWLVEDVVILDGGDTMIDLAPMRGA
jgi:hypothetical protein